MFLKRLFGPRRGFRQLSLRIARSSGYPGLFAVHQCRNELFVEVREIILQLNRLNPSRRDVYLHVGVR